MILHIDLLLQDFIETLLDSVARQARHGELKLKYFLLISPVSSLIFSKTHLALGVGEQVLCLGPLVPRVSHQVRLDADIHQLQVIPATRQRKIKFQQN